MPREKEVPLSGGRTTPGVVRVGDTVRRPAGKNAGFVRGLLRHLEHQGFNGAPRMVGTDDRGRDILSYIEGDVPADLGWYDDAVLVAAARLIRRFHDATVSFLDEDLTSGRSTVVCHHDLSPCNAVFRDGLPIALIDFDAARPGARQDDVGYAAWLWLDIGNPEIVPAEQRRRFRLFLAAYDDELAERVVIKAVMARQRQLMGDGHREGRDSMVHWAAACLDWTDAHL